MAKEIGVTTRVLLGAEDGRTPLPGNQKLIADYFGFDLLVQWPEPDEVLA